MNHLQIIQDILASATATPVAPLQMYQGEALPYVVYDVTANPENTKAVVTGLDIITLNVYIFNNDLDEAQTTANLIRQALTTQKNTGVQSAALNYFDFDYVDQINSNLILQTYNVRMAYTGNVEPLRALYTLLAEASATLTIPAFIAANYTLSGAVTATITVTKLLAGTYSLSATASAALRVGSELAGSYTLNAAASAALIVAKQFAGTYSLTASSNAALIVQKLMAGGYTLNAALSATVDLGASYLLDTYTGAAAAYSLRQLKTGVTSVVRVRRSSDDAEVDFTATEITDGTLVAWTGANDGFVVTWYDQSGNARNAAQTTVANQPQIVSSGSVILDNGKPITTFNGLSQSLETSSSVVSTDFGVFGVGNMNNSSSAVLFTQYSQVDAERTIFFMENDTTRLIGIQIGTVSLKTGTPSNAQKLYYYNRLDADIEFADNGSAVNTFVNSTICQNSPLRMGAYIAGSVAYVKQNIQEIVIYSSDQSTNRTGIETNINDYYGIY